MKNTNKLLYSSRPLSPGFVVLESSLEREVGATVDAVTGGGDPPGWPKGPIEEGAGSNISSFAKSRTKHNKCKDLSIS